jgi:pilus assembly protein CpaF
MQARRVNAPITSPQAGSYFDLKTRVQNKLLAELDPSTDVTRTEEVRRTIQELFEQILTEENIVLSRPERARRLPPKSWDSDHSSRCWKTIPSQK